jgi:hypothetical protein
MPYILLNGTKFERKCIVYTVADNRQGVVLQLAAYFMPQNLPDIEIKQII